MERQHAEKERRLKEKLERERAMYDAHIQALERDRRGEGSSGGSRRK